MKIRQELADPWGWLVAGVSGGVGWAVLAGSAPAGIPVVAGTLIGIGVLTTKVGLGAIRPRSPAPAPVLKRLPTPAPDGAAAALLLRARRASSRTSDLAGSTSDPWLRAQMTQVELEVVRVSRSLQDVAGRVTLLEESLAQSEPVGLTDEAARLTTALARATDDQLRAETQSALAAVEQQRDVLRRLRDRRDTLLRRMETTVTGMEVLAASMGEIVAMGASSFEHDDASSRVSALTCDLEALSAGLDEARRLG
jgi:hypothetical protein